MVVGGAARRPSPKLEQRLAERRTGCGRLEAKLEQRLGELREGLLTLRGELRDDLHAQGKMLMRWTFRLWITTVVTLGGLVVGCCGSFRPPGRNLPRVHAEVSGPGCQEPGVRCQVSGVGCEGTTGP
jgi:hypothetical protein